MKLKLIFALVIFCILSCDNTSSPSYSNKLEYAYKITYTNMAFTLKKEEKVYGYEGQDLGITLTIHPSNTHFHYLQISRDAQKLSPEDIDIYENYLVGNVNTFKYVERRYDGKNNIAVKVIHYHFKCNNKFYVHYSLGLYKEPFDEKQFEGLIPTLRIIAE